MNKNPLSIRPPQTDYLAFAACRGSLFDIQHYIRKLPETINAFSAGRTPVLWAISAGRYDAMEILIKDGGDITLRTANGHSALTCAVWSGKAAMVQRMLDRGFDPAEKDAQGKTALDWAREARHTDIIRLLEEPTRAALERLRAADAARKRGVLNNLSRRKPFRPQL